MYKMYYSLHPPTINIMYIKNCDVHNHNTRHRYYHHVSMAHSDLYAKSFNCSSILIWNDIMNKIIVRVSCPQFKILVKAILISQLFKEVELSDLQRSIGFLSHLIYRINVIHELKRYSWYLYPFLCTLCMSK